MSHLYPGRCVAVGKFSSAARLREAGLFQKARLLACNSPGFLLSDASSLRGGALITTAPTAITFGFPPGNSPLELQLPFNSG